MSPQKDWRGCACVIPARSPWRPWTPPTLALVAVALSFCTRCYCCHINKYDLIAYPWFLLQVGDSSDSETDLDEDVDASTNSIKPSAVSSETADKGAWSAAEIIALLQVQSQQPRPAWKDVPMLLQKRAGSSAVRTVGSYESKFISLKKLFNSNKLASIVTASGASSAQLAEINMLMSCICLPSSTGTQKPQIAASGGPAADNVSTDADDSESEKDNDMVRVGLIYLCPG